MKISLRTDFDPEIWNGNLKKSEYGTVYQTTAYGDYSKHHIKKNTLFVTAEENEEPLGLLLLFKGSRFHDRLFDKPLSGLPLKLLERFRPELSWYFGPVVLCKEREDEIYKEILKEIARITVGNNVRVSYATPHPLNDKNEFFVHAGFKSENLGTFVIDLRQDVATLWSNLDKKSARKNVERARERGIAVETIDNVTEFNAYFEILNEGRIRSGVKPYSYDGVYRLWKILGTSGMMKGFVAKKDERFLAGLLISAFNGYLNEWGAAHSSYSVENRLYANDLLKWHVIEWGHNEGYRYYDLTGVELKPKDAKEEGIYRFKEKWGGKLVIYHKYTL